MKKFFVNRQFDILYSQFFEFLYNKKLLELVNKFDNSFFVDTNIFTHLYNLSKFSTCWDYRKKQNATTKIKSGENARWLLKNDDFVLNLSNLIIEVAKELTLIGNTDLIFHSFDYILILGGARETNILRPLYTKMLIDKYNLNNLTIVGLTCDRAFDVTENTKNFTYPDFVKTEYDALKYGINNLEFNNLNINIEILKTPNPFGQNRANSKNTYEYFFKTIYDNNKNNILLISSQIYAPYQSICFMPFAEKYNINFDIVGYPYNIYDNTGLYKHAEPVKYLQEFRSTILEMKNFMELYKYEFDKYINK